MRVKIGIAYDMLRRIVQEEMKALKATVGPRYRSPNMALKTQVRTIVRIGTSHLGWI
jgi:hypothetical protein